DAESLKAKVLHLERRRVEDRARLQQLERLTADHAKTVRIVHRLEAKIQPMHAETVRLRARADEAEAARAALETRVAELTEVLDLATVEREIAEEQAEGLREEAGAARLRIEELGLEAELLREDVAELRAAGPGAPTDDTWAQAAQLREALIKLRDVTSAQEAELKEEIWSLRKQVSALTQVQRKYDGVLAQLRHTEDVSDTLRQQLEVSVGAEQMLEDLTEKNLALAEQVEEMRATIDDLETLKEISDELDATHVETEKQLRAEVAQREAVIREQAQRIEEDERAYADYEYTVARFRELVASLQTDLDDLRASAHDTESDTRELNLRSRDLLDLNLRLRSLATKSQGKSIEIDLRRLELEQAQRRLDIVRRFLPTSLESTQAAVETLLCLGRLCHKGTLLASLHGDRLAEHNQTDHELAASRCLAVAGERRRLVALAAAAGRMAALMEQPAGAEPDAALETFERRGALLGSLAPVERHLDASLGALQRGDDRADAETAAVLDGFLAALAAADETYFTEKSSLADSLAAEAAAASLAAAADNAGLALRSTPLGARTPKTPKTPRTPRTPRAPTALDTGAEAVAEHCRTTAAAARKLAAVVATARDAGVAPTAEDTATVLAAAAALCAPEHALEQAPEEPVAALKALVSSTLCALAAGPADETAAAARTTQLVSELRSVQARVSGRNTVTAIPTAVAPWDVRADTLRQQEDSLSAAHARVSELTEDLRRLALERKQSDVSAEEAVLRTSLLEARLAKAQARVEHAAQLERELRARDDRVRALEADVDALREQVAALEAAADTGLAAAADAAARAAADPASAPNMAAAAEVSALRAEVAALQSAVRFLRQPAPAPTWLSVPLLAKPKPSASGPARTALLESVLAFAAGAEMVKLERTRGAWRSKRTAPQTIAAAQAARYRALVG
ncbi:dynein associated protein-domain-containing protein, partial [Dipodascopsis tothii]|uniref:dynein associated protein-domain-containing protein n=1 Tax=Dipodascopsis tothii TaxID=44089 RepID=UPI0034CF9D13